MLTSGETKIYEEDITVGGERRASLMTKFPFRDDRRKIVGIIGIARDITGRKLAENALRDSERKFRNLIEGSIQGIIVDRGLDQRILFANQAVVTMLGYDHPNDLLVLKMSDVFAPHEYERIKKYDEARSRADFENAPLRYEAQYARKDGSLIWTDSVVNIVDWEGAPAFQGTVIDITERKKAEEQLRQSQKMDAVGQLTAGVAHDFNNLLAIIMSHAEVLRAQLGGDEDSVNSLIKAAARGSDLTKKLLAFSRKQALRPELIDLHSLISGMSDLLARSLGENIEIGILTAKRLWPAYADPGQMENAILNLAINARDAMPKGGRISFELGNVRLDNVANDEGVELRPGAYVKIEVADNGEGMTAEVMKRAFDPFYTTKGVGEGSGLGLSMVFGFVQQSGGDIHISSTEGQGTKVRLYLPRSEQEALPIRENMRRPDPKAHGEKILVVEDDPDVRGGISTLLLELGYVVHESRDGELALAELEANPDIELLLCDVMLPGGVDGPEVVNQARRKHADLKVIFMTGYADRNLRKCGPIGDSVSVLTKPFKKVDLAETVEELG